MQAAALFLASLLLVAGDPVRDFEVAGVRLGMKYSDVEKRLPELHLVRSLSVLEEGYSHWMTKPGDLPHVNHISLEFVGDTLHCITVCYTQKQFEKPGIDLFCDALRDRFGEADAEEDDGSLYAWVSQRRECTAMLVKYSLNQAVILRVEVAGTLNRTIERNKRAVDLGF